MTNPSNYFYEYITEMLGAGRPTAIPKDVLEKEGLDLQKLNRKFLTKQGPFGLIHFLSLRKQTS